MLNHISESIYLLVIGLLILRNADLGAEALDRKVMVGVGCAALLASGFALAAPGSAPWLVGATVMIGLAAIAAVGGVPGLRLAMPSAYKARSRIVESALIIAVAAMAKYVWQHQ